MIRLVIAVAAAFAALYIALDFNKLHALYYGFDNGIFLQSIAQLAHGGSAFNWAEGKSHFFVHDSWIVALLVPFVKVWPYQETLIVTQVLLLSGSAIALYAFARTVGVEDVPSALLSIAYLISPSVQGFAYNDFSEGHFEPLLIFLFAIAAARRNILWTLVCAQLLLGVKEDVALFLIWFGIAGAIWYDRRIGIAVAVLAAVNAVVYHAILAMHGEHASIPPYHPWILYPLQDTAFLLEILAPFAFAPLLLRWRVLLALPLLAELFMAMNRDGFPMARAGTHYTEPLVALCAIGAALVLRSLPKLSVWSLTLSVLMALFFNTTVLHFGRHLYVPDETAYRTARAFVPDQRPASFSAEQQSAWAVAAGDLNARISGFGRPLHYQRPAWNRE